MTESKHSQPWHSHTALNWILDRKISAPFGSFKYVGKCVHQINTIQLCLQQSVNMCGSPNDIRSISNLTAQQRTLITGFILENVGTAAAIY